MRARANGIRALATIVVGLGCLLSVTPSVRSQVPAAERQTLISLFDNTGGTDWFDNEGWLGDPGTECDWFGVVCEATSVPEQFRVQSLFLFNNGLSGPIPDLSSLAALEVIELQQNQLNGQLPELAPLSQLRRLLLFSNQIGGPIPSLEGLDRLEVLILGSNDLSGPIPNLSDLTSVEAILLDQNELTGPIPELSTLTSLRQLILNDNRLTGSIPDLSQLTRLEELGLSDNQLTGVIPELARLTELAELGLGSNQLTGAIPSLAGLSQLASLDLSSNRLSGQIPDLSDLTQLVSIRLALNELTGPIPELAALGRVEDLNFQGNRLTGEIPDLSALTRLENLELHLNDLSGALPDFTNNVQLRRIVLFDNQLTSPISPLTGLDQLQELNLVTNELTGPIPDLSGFSQLEVLHLWDNHLSGPFPLLPAGAPLRILTLGSNQLVGEIPATLSDFTQVTDLYLGFNGLTATSDTARNYVDALEPGALQTQTVPPELVTVVPIDATSVVVGWSVIDFTGFDGGYRVSVSSNPNGPFELAGDTVDKTVSFLRITGLEPGDQHFFRVQTFTLPNVANRNQVVSEPSAVVSSTTAPSSATGALELTFASQRASEGERKRLLVQRVGGASGAVTADIRATGGSATEGSDFVISGTLEWQDGDAEPKAITVEVIDDGQQEGDEQFAVELRALTGGAVLGSRTQATVTIAEKDLFTDGVQGELISIGSEPALADDGLGGRVAVWAGARGDSSIIFVQRYDANGSALGSQVPVSQSSDALNREPDVAVSSQGEAIVVWEQDSTSILGRRLGASGELVGSEFQVDDGSSSSVSSPEVSINAAGQFFVVWKGLNPGLEGGGSAPGTSILGRSFSPSGDPIGTSVALSGDSQNPSAPDVAVDDDGGVMVVFEAGPESDSDIFATLVDLGGDLAPSPVRVNQFADGDQRKPGVADVPGSGDFGVVWQGVSLADSSSARREPGGDVWFQRVTSDGSTLGNEDVRVNTDESGSQSQPSIDTTASGNCIVGWQDTSASAQTSILGRVFPGCGQAGGEEVVVSDLDAATDVRNPAISAGSGEVTAIYQLDDIDEGDGGIAGRTASIDIGEASCQQSATDLCLNDERFRVSVDWSDFEGNSGTGQAVSLTPDTGFFWFFDEANVELVIKVLDACSFANSFWVFAGGLTNVAAEITVTDTATGQVRAYSNTLGSPFQPVQDTAAFQTCGALGRIVPWPKQLSDGVLEELEAMALRPSPNLARAAQPGTGCTGGPVLCVNQARFTVSVDYATPQGDSGAGQAVQLTGDTGYFWFFSPDNVEMVIKVLDACSFSNHFWVFAGGLTDVEATVTVTDTETGASTVYSNPLGTPFQPVQDTAAFMTCQ